MGESTDKFMYGQMYIWPDKWVLPAIVFSIHIGAIVAGEIS